MWTGNVSVLWGLECCKPNDTKRSVSIRGSKNKTCHFGDGWSLSCPHISAISNPVFSVYPTMFNVSELLDFFVSFDQTVEQSWGSTNSDHVYTGTVDFWFAGWCDMDIYPRINRWNILWHILWWCVWKRNIPPKYPKMAILLGTFGKWRLTVTHFPNKVY